MTAAFEDGKQLHIIKWTGRVRLHAGAQAYCGVQHDAAAGVLQVPQAVFEHPNASYVLAPGQVRKPCANCRIAAQASVQLGG